jgi:uncharacterized protein (DUF1501 family)
MAHTRRQFIKRGITFVGAGLAAPRLLLSPDAVWAKTGSLGDRIFVLVELNGGNDGLNTVVPYTQSQYYSYRPTLALRSGEYLPITDSVGLHGNMTALKGLYDQGRVAVVQGVGYPNPNRSHFRSTEIWQTAVPEVYEPTGWLGRYLDKALGTADGDLEGISVGYTAPQAFNTVTATTASVASLDAYSFDVDPAYPEDAQNKVRAFIGLNDDLRGGDSTLDFLARTGLVGYESAQVLASAASTYVPAVAYPSGAQDPYGFGAAMTLVAQMIGARLGTNVYYVSLGSFDTHAQQAGQHAALLRSLSDGMAAFYQDMVAHGRGDDVLVMTYSEFGRRVDQNSSGGTDHGAAAPLFVLGNAVRGGVYGDHPSLTNLGDGDLIYTVDFRSVYTTVLRGWFDVDPQAVLGGSYENLGFLNPASDRPKAREAPAVRGIVDSRPPTLEEMERHLNAVLRPCTISTARGSERLQRER